MSQRKSGYTRIPHERYETPAWVTQALVPHLPEFDGKIWEPACGSGQMVVALRAAGFDVVGTDIVQGQDFLKTEQAPTDTGAVVTNPPYNLATEFIEHALSFDVILVVAMLLRTDFDHAANRAHLFGQNTTFAQKVVLTTHIRWFENSTNSPSFNHAWFIWSKDWHPPPILKYAGMADVQGESRDL
jgi:hypothetical protein